MKQIILIGGAPATGKSSLAKKISENYSIPWISTDFIRSWMKMVVDSEKYPGLFNFENTTAEDHYGRYSISETIEMESARDEMVWSGGFVIY